MELMHSLRHYFWFHGDNGSHLFLIGPIRPYPLNAPKQHIWGECYFMIDLWMFLANNILIWRMITRYSYILPTRYSYINLVGFDWNDSLPIEPVVVKQKCHHFPSFYNILLIIKQTLQGFFCWPTIEKYMNWVRRIRTFVNFQ